MRGGTAGEGFHLPFPDLHAGRAGDGIARS
jgi:hypothetical protein